MYFFLSYLIWALLTSFVRQSRVDRLHRRSFMGDVLGLSLVGLSGARLGLSWAVLSLSWAVLGLAWACLGLVLDLSWAVLGLSWACLGAFWVCLGSVLGLSWASLGPSRAFMRLSWPTWPGQPRNFSFHNFWWHFGAQNLPENS